MKIRFLVLIFISWSGHAADLSDTQAKQQAQKMFASIDVLRTKLSEANPDTYRLQVRPKLDAAIRQWPDQHLQNRAVFPYFSCKQAALDLMEYADNHFLFSSAAGSLQWGERKKRRFDDSYAECAASIKNPDMGLKDIQ